MIVGIGAAASLLDAVLSPLTQPSTAKLSATSPSGPSSASANSIFSVDSQSTTTISSSDAISSPSAGNISPQTMSALIAAQSDASAATPASATTTANTIAAAPKDPLTDLFSLLDTNGDGQISKSEFESALGAGGTNLQNADSVFAKLDTNGDGSVSPSELGAALKGKGHHHHHAGGAGDTSGADALSQALQDASGNQQTNADGSVTTTMTYADGSKVTMTTAPGNTTASSANLLEQMIQRQSAMLAASAASSVATGSSLAVTI